MSEQPTEVRTEKKKPRRWWRTLRRVVLIGLGVLVLVIALSVKPVDRTPYFGTDYYNTTREDFLNNQKDYQAATGSLQAGFGRAKLTPELGADHDDPELGKFKQLPLAGFQQRKGKPATGVHDDLWAKAVAMQVGDHRLLMLRLDALILPTAISSAAIQQIQEKHGLKREEIYLSTTHTHSGIGGWGNDLASTWGFTGAYNPEVPKWFVRQLVAAADDALSHMKPASIGSGRFHAPTYVRNRLRRYVKDSGPIDDECSYLLLKQQDGATAVVVTYNAHANCVPTETMEMSADYPGYLERRIEEKTGGFAMYVAGSVGSHEPNYQFRQFEGARKLGEGLADELLPHLPDTQLSPETTLGTLGLNLWLPDSQYRVTDGWRLRPTITNQMAPVEAKTFLQAARIGDTLWFSTPCDFSGELALDLKATFGVRGIHASVTSFNGDYIGYVVPQQYYSYFKYESRWMSFYGPYVSPLFMDWMKRMGDVIIPPAK